MSFRFQYATRRRLIAGRRRFGTVHWVQASKTSVSTAWPFMMGPTGCPAISVTSNIPEERMPHLHGGGNLKRHFCTVAYQLLLYQSIILLAS